jgi:hypothetical protein
MDKRRAADQVAVCVARLNQDRFDLAGTGRQTGSKRWR